MECGQHVAWLRKIPKGLGLPFGATVWEYARIVESHWRADEVSLAVRCDDDWVGYTRVKRSEICEIPDGTPNLPLPIETV